MNEQPQKSTTVKKMKPKKFDPKFFMSDVFKSGHVVEHKKFWFTFPLIFVVIGIIVFAAFWGATGSFSKGMNIGIDFTGGNMLTINLNAGEASKPENVEKVYQIIQTNDGNPASNQVSADVALVVRYTFDNKDNAYQSAQNDEIKRLVETELSAIGSKTADGEFVYYKNIGASASSQLISSAFLSLFIALVLILVYVAFRFKFWSGLSAVVALLHDVILMLAFTVIFRIQVNTNFVAAIITIVAYSINNTIVVFDRVRENDKANDKQGGHLTNAEIVNASVKQTMRRSINTTVTTLFGILLLAIIGAPSIREFALPVIFGLIAGLYSSIAVAPSMYVGVTDALKRKKKKGMPSGGDSKSGKAVQTDDKQHLSPKTASGRGTSKKTAR